MVFRPAFLQKLIRHVFQSRQPKRMLIQTRNPCEIFSASIEKCLPPAYANLLDGFQTIGNERGTNHEQLFHAPCRKPLQLVFSGGREPGITAEPGLKSNGVFGAGDVRPADEAFDSLETLSAITSGMRRAGRFATVGSAQAMTTGRVGFFNLTLGHAVETEK